VNEDQKRHLTSIVRGRVLYDAPCRDYTWFKVGGPADLLVFPQDREDVSAVLQYAREERIPVFVMGEGSNLVVRDKGFRGIMIKLSEGFNDIAVEREHEEHVELRALAGARLMRVVQIAYKHGLTGLEFAAGIPGSVGGAVMMNAGAFGKEIQDVIQSILIITGAGTVTRLQRDRIRFGYRNAGLPADTIVLDALFALARGAKHAIGATMNACLAKRKERQPLDLPNAGSAFCNPPGHYAAQLIEEAGLKGFAVGDAAVSRRHANFIVNRGNASAQDIIALMKVIQDTIKRTAGITLEPEIRVVGENG